MENTETKASKKRHRHHDRVALDQDCLERIDGWIEQVMQAAKGVTVTRKDMVNWIIKSQEEVLPASVVNELKAQFFNEVRFLQQAIKEVRAAKSRGEQVSLDALLGEQPHSSSKRLRIVKNRRGPNPLVVDKVHEFDN